jgi:pimeloyl-ACP methyl ester carboxylesterase
LRLASWLPARYATYLRWLSHLIERLGVEPTLALWREMTAYEALHLACDGPARLVEALIRSYGTQGKLMAYDVLRAERIEAGSGRTGSVAEFIADFTAQPREANLFTAGLTTEVMHVSEHEVLLHVHECEWARYYRERHPQVGYLMACSTDEAAYRAFNDSLRLQRTSTLMEGGLVCDFRIYSAKS